MRHLKYIAFPNGSSSLTSTTDLSVASSLPSPPLLIAGLPTAYPGRSKQAYSPHAQKMERGIVSLTERVKDLVTSLKNAIFTAEISVVKDRDDQRIVAKLLAANVATWSPKEITAVLLTAVSINSDVLAHTKIQELTTRMDDQQVAAIYRRGKPSILALIDWNRFSGEKYSMIRDFVLEKVGRSYDVIRYVPGTVSKDSYRELKHASLYGITQCLDGNLVARSSDTFYTTAPYKGCEGNYRAERYFIPTTKQPLTQGQPNRAQ